MRILALGDSITQGPDDVPGGYRGFLENILAARGISSEFTGSKRANSSGMRSPWHEGHPGFRIGHLRTGFTSDHSSSQPIGTILDLHRPDIVLLMAGTNNLYFDQPEDALAEMRDLVESILHHDARSTLLLATLLPIYPGPKPWGSCIPEDVGHRVGAFNSMLCELATSYGLDGARGSIVDMHACAHTREDLTDDGVHPCERLLSRMAVEWASGLFRHL